MDWPSEINATHYVANGDGKMTDKLLTIDELAEALGGVGRASIYRHIKALPGFPQLVKVGAATRFRQSDVQAFIRGDTDTAGEAQ